MNKINLENIRRCNQVWEEMEKNERGRICKKCQNTILDFRSMTDAEVAQTHMFSEGPVCGLYREDQLRMSPEKKKHENWSSAAMVIFGLFTSISLSSQSNSQITKIEIQEAEYNPKGYKRSTVDTTKTSQNNDELLVYGTVKSQNRAPLQGATILVKGTSTGTVTDIRGYYSINLNKLLSDSTEIILNFSCSGMITQELRLNKQVIFTNGELEVSTILYEDPHLGMDFAVYSKDKFHHRLRRRIRGLFRRRR